MRSLRPLAASGLSNLPDNPTPLPDEGPLLSSGLYGASSGSCLESDDKKSLINAEYSSHRRVCRVIREGMREGTRGEWEEGSRRWCPGWSGSLPCRATCHRPDRAIQGLPLIERTDEASGRKVAERNAYMVQADWLTRALGSTLAEMFAKLERGPNERRT
jgi:hypothetical protein